MFLFRNSKTNALIKSANRYINILHILITIICIYSILQAFMCIEILVPNPIFSWNHDLGMAATHSFIFILSGITLVIWIYQRVPCCGCCGYLSNNSTCFVYGCSGFCEFWYFLCYCYCCKWCGFDKVIGYDFDSTATKRRNADRNSDKHALLLQESTVKEKMVKTTTGTRKITCSGTHETITAQTGGVYVTLNDNVSDAQNGQDGGDGYVEYEICVNDK